MLKLVVPKLRTVPLHPLHRYRKPKSSYENPDTWFA
jgi:hypothetical protein